MQNGSVVDKLFRTDYSISVWLPIVGHCAATLFQKCYSVTYYCSISLLNVFQNRHVKIQAI